MDYYNEKYKVKRAKGLTDESVLYGEMSKGKMWFIGITAFVVTVGIFVGTISLYNM